MCVVCVIIICFPRKREKCHKTLTVDPFNLTQLYYIGTREGYIPTYSIVDTLMS